MSKEVSRLPVAVIITTYNDEDYLTQAIESVFAQTPLPEQIIVVDDGSDQNRASELVRKYVSNPYGVQICCLRKNNGGPSSARNYGLAHTTEPYVAFLDVDDKLLPGNIEKKYSTLKELADEYFGVYSGGIRSDGIQQDFALIDGAVDACFLDKNHEGIPGGAPHYLFRRQSLLDIGGFDEQLTNNEDYDLLIRLLKIKKCKGIAHTGYYRNIRPNSQSRPADPIKSLSGVMTFLDKAQEQGYYTREYLAQRRMLAHWVAAKALLKNKRLIGAFLHARRAFAYDGPLSTKQKLAYMLSFSFIGGK